jgi:hypothetical protein
MTVSGITKRIGLVVVLALVPLAAQATSFVWSGSGGTSTWERDTSAFNWTGGDGASHVYPGQGTSYADQATISASSNNPVKLGTTQLLGGTTTVLTIGSTAGTNSLDITSTGILGISGGSISIGTTRRITVEGALRNDGAAGTHYAIGGASTTGVVLNGGAVSSLSGGVWDFQRPVQGWGAVSAPFTNTSTGAVSANVSGQILHITGGGTISGALGSTLAGAILSIESAITAASGTVTISHTGEVDLNGANLIGAPASHFSINNSSGDVKLTGDSTWTGNIDLGSNGHTLVNGFTLTLTNVVLANSNTSSLPLDVGAGILNIDGPANMTNGGYVHLGGGTVTGSAITGNNKFVGFGTFAAPLPSGYGDLRAQGGTLVVTGNVNQTGLTILTNSGAADVLDLRSTLTATNSAWLYPNLSGNPGPGKVYLTGATILGPTGVGQVYTIGQGTVDVVNDSTVSGNVFSNATFVIDSAKQLNTSGATVSVNLGSLTNNGALVVGAGILNNGTVTTYNMTGGGSVTLAGGSITSTGGGGFASDNALSGYGNLTAPYANSGSVTASGGTLLVNGSGVITGAGNVVVNGGVLEVQTPASQVPVLTGAGADTQKGKIVFDYPDQAATIAGLLATSYHGGLWDIGQFRSTTRDGTHGLGWLDDGSAKVTVMYTLYGDSNLDGAVNGDDLNTVLSNYNATGSGWSQGDFNYDGTVDGSDLNMVLSNYNQTLSVGAAVPEPTTLVLLAVGVIGGVVVFGWRRKRIAA